MRLNLTIELGTEGIKDGYDAYQAIAQSNIGHHRAGQYDEGDFQNAARETIGHWSIGDSQTVEQIAAAVIRNEYGAGDSDCAEEIMQRVLDVADDQTAHDLVDTIERAVREARA